jgi:hypothetical protein
MQSHVYAEFPAGTYYFGDICLALSEEVYEDFWGAKYKYADGVYDVTSELKEAAEDFGDVGDFEEPLVSHLRRFAVAATKSGDGKFEGTSGRLYYVDGGNLGLVSAALIDPTKKSKAKKFGKIFTHKNPISFQANNGYFTISDKYREIEEVGTSYSWGENSTKAASMKIGSFPIQLSEGRKSNILKVLSQLHAYLKRYQDLDKTEEHFKQRLEDAGCTDMYAVIDDILDIVETGKPKEKARLLNRVYKTYFPKTAEKDPASDEELETAMGEGEQEEGEKQLMGGNDTDLAPPMSASTDEKTDWQPERAEENGLTLGDVRKDDEAYMSSEGFDGEEDPESDLQSDLDRSRGKLDDETEIEESIRIAKEYAMSLREAELGGLGDVGDFEEPIRFHCYVCKNPIEHNDLFYGFPDKEEIGPLCQDCYDNVVEMHQEEPDDDGWGRVGRYGENTEEDFGDVSDFEEPFRNLAGTRHPENNSGSLDDEAFDYIEDLKFLRPEMSKEELVDNLVDEFSSESWDYPLERGMALDIIEDYEGARNPKNEEVTNGQIEAEYGRLAADNIPDAEIIDQLIRKYKLTRHELEMMLGEDRDDLRFWDFEDWQPSEVDEYPMTEEDQAFEESIKEAAGILPDGSAFFTATIGKNKNKKGKKKVKESILPNNFKQIASKVYNQLAAGRNEEAVINDLMDHGYTDNQVGKVFDKPDQVITESLPGPSDQHAGQPTQEPAPAPATPYDTSSSNLGTPGTPPQPQGNPAAGAPQNAQTQQLLQNPEFGDFFQAMSKINPNDLQNLTKALGQPNS